MSFPDYLDTLGIWEATAGFPEQLDASRTATADSLGDLSLPDLNDISSVVMFGMGSSGIAAEAVAAYGLPVTARPILVGHSFDVPSFVGPDTLVVAISHSGTTAETLAAAESALERGAYVLTVSNGGALSTLTSSTDALHLASAPELPVSRVALPSLVTPVVMALAQIGVLPDIESALDASHEVLAKRRDAFLTPDNEAEKVARTIGRTIPLIYGSSGVVAVAAERWKAQVNEYAKTPAFFSVQPELAHNEVSGWGQHGDITRQILSLVTLRYSEERPEIDRRFATVLQATDEVMANVIPVWSQGTDDLSRFFDLAFFGDMVALYLAGRESIDPGPVATDGLLDQPSA